MTVFVNKFEYQTLLDAGVIEEDDPSVIVTDDVPSARKPLPMQRISKHRAGRTTPLTKEHRRKRDRRERIVTQARKHLFLEHQADARALQSAFESRESA